LNAILYWSEECYRISGYDPAQGLPSFESSFQRVHPEDRSALTETIERAVREKATFQADYRQVLPDGTRRNVHIQANPVLDASGELVEFVGTVMDLTEQKRAEDEHREHLWFLESMDRINRAMQRGNNVESMTSAVMQEALEIFACDRVVLVHPCDPEAPVYHTVMERASPQYTGALTLGIDLPATPEGAELNRRCLHDSGVVVDPRLPAELHERFRIASMLTIAVRPKGDQPYRFTVQCMRKRSWTAVELRLFEEIARRMEDTLTSVLAYRNLLVRDADLRRSRAYLAEAQKVSHTGSWAWNIETREIVYWSDECFRIHGRDPAQGLPSLEQVFADMHPDDARRVVASLDQLREGREREGQYRMINFADGPRTIRTTAHPIPDNSGRVVECIGTVVDITEQKRAERELRTSELERARAQQALRDAREKLAQASRIASLAELSASIAHEINQPLQAIVANGHASLRWLDATPPNIEKAIRTAQRVVRDGNDAAEVVSRIRALFKHAAPAKVDLDLNMLITQVRTLMADEAQGSGVSLEIELDEDLPGIRADAVQIQQVIVNLVRNAIEAMTEAPRKSLLIRSRRGADHVAVDVRDQGTGLANLDKIFEPFVTTKQTGMGMGLAICRSIIEAHAGEIRVVHNEGPGVTFSFSLPIVASGAT
jgi:PAS domain S-box-containing protein